MQHPHVRPTGQGAQHRGEEQQDEHLRLEQHGGRRPRFDLKNTIIQPAAGLEKHADLLLATPVTSDALRVPTPRRLPILTCGTVFPSNGSPLREIAEGQKPSAPIWR